MQGEIRYLIDRLAVGLSGLCVVHCIASSLLVAAVASTGGALLDPMIHQFGLLAALILATVGLGLGLHRHRSWRPMLIGGGGLVLMACALAAPHGIAETLLTIVGVTLVAAAHLLNRHLAI